MSPNDPASNELVAAASAEGAEEDLRPEDLSWVERNGAYVLTAAGVVAWTLAALNVDRETAAAAWITAGFVLLAAAAFFQRVVKVGKDGIELARVRQVIRDAHRLVPQEGDTPDEAQQRVLLFIEKEVHAPPADDTEARLSRQAAARRRSRRELMERDRIENNLTAAVFNWLSAMGYDVARERGDEVRVDLKAVKDSRILYVELRPFIDALGRADAAALAARMVPVEDASRAIVLRRGVDIATEADQLLNEHGIAIWTADPDDIAIVEIRSRGSLPDPL